MTLKSSAATAAVASAALFVLVGLLLRTVSGLQPLSPQADPTLLSGFRLLFLVLGGLLALLYAWRYLSVARAAAANGLDLRHRRRLSRARYTAIWTAFVLVLFCATLIATRSPALPLAVGCLIVAVAWASAATATVRAERAQPDSR